MDYQKLLEQGRNFIFIGEAGCGKSEIALNLAAALLKEQDRPVEFFDLDMTKPLFRSRDVADSVRALGIDVHYEEQFRDSPTLTGGVEPAMKDPERIAILDVGGDYIGARTLGVYLPFIMRPDTMVFFIVNPYRPWSLDIDHIDGVLGEVLGVSHIPLSKVTFVGNPNLGLRTDVAEVLEGIRRLKASVEEYVPIAFFGVREEIAEDVSKECDGMEIMPLTLYLTYPWEDN